MTTKGGFVFYDSFYETAMELKKTDKSLALEYLEAIMKYGLYGEIYEGNPIIKAMVITPQVSIDAANNRYKQAVENGKKGGRPRKNDWSEIARLNREGYSNKEIGEMVGYTPDYVGKILKNQRDYAMEQKNQKNLTEKETHTHTDTGTETLTNNEKDNITDSYHKF